MANRVNGDHIFQGIIYGKPSHPLLRQAIQHAFSRQVFAPRANMDSVIFCKYLEAGHGHGTNCGLERPQNLWARLPLLGKV